MDSNSEKNDAKISILKILLNGTLLAIIIAVPAIISTILFHYVIKTNLIITISAGIITLFVAMGFAYKISRRLSMWYQLVNMLSKGWLSRNLHLVYLNQRIFAQPSVSLE